MVKILICTLIACNVDAPPNTPTIVLEETVIEGECRRVLRSFAVYDKTTGAVVQYRSEGFWRC